MAKYIEFASDSDLIKGAVGQVLNEKDLDMRFEVPQPIKGGIYDRKIFGNTGHCTCHLITQGVCPQCGEMVYSETDYKKNYAYYQLHMPFIIRLKLDSLIDKFTRLGIKLPKPKSVKGTVNRDNLASIWSLEFSIIHADSSELEAKVEDLAEKMGGKDQPLEEYPLEGKNGKPYILQIFELQPYSDINLVGPMGLKQLAWYSYEGKSLAFINDHINSVLPLMSPGLRNYTIREIGGKPTKDIPEISLEYKMIIYADKYIKNANETLNFRNTIDQASMCYLLNCLYDQHIQNADMLQTSKQATFRKNVGTRVGASMRGNAISYLGASIGEIYLPKALAYHALQTQIIDKLCEDGRQGYDALKLYLKMDQRAIDAFHYIVDHSQVLMNRNPSLHRNNILQYTPRLWQDDTPAIGVNPYVCFTGDTKVKFLDGTFHTMEDLATNYADKSFYVYSVDEQGNPVAGKAHSPRKTKEVTELIELEFETGIIRCTPDHQFLVQTPDNDLIWKQAKHLSENDDIYELQLQLSTIKMGFVDYRDYEEIHASNGTRQLTHQAVMRNATKKLDDYAIDHINCDKLNNSPDNLQLLSKKEHGSKSLTEYNKSTKHTEDIRLTVLNGKHKGKHNLIKYNKSKKHKKLVAQSNKQNFKDSEYRQRILSSVNLGRAKSVLRYHIERGTPFECAYEKLTPYHKSLLSLQDAKNYYEEVLNEVQA